MADGPLFDKNRPANDEETPCVIDGIFANKYVRSKLHFETCQRT